LRIIIRGHCFQSLNPSIPKFAIPVNYAISNFPQISALLRPENEEPGMGDQDGDYHEWKCRFHETDKADPVTP